MTEKRLAVGILGGMGPEATVDLMRRIIEGTPAADDGDHIRMFVDNNPQVPSRIAALVEGTGTSPLPVLQQMARNLEQQGVDLLAMPCNTAHHYYADIASQVSIPFVNILDETATRLRAALGSGVRRVGLLASSALRGIALYEPAFRNVELELVYPSDSAQAALMDLIRSVKAGRHEQAGLDAFAGAADDLATQGVDALLIACTELSAIAPPSLARVACFDSAQFLADAVVERATGPTHKVT